MEMSLKKQLAYNYNTVAQLITTKTNTIIDFKEVHKNVNQK